MAKLDTPLVSIITPSLNSASYIETAIASVMKQDYSHIEHIIVDGASTDGTLDILTRYQHLRLVEDHEQKGVYYANNLGIQRASGELIGILNADDFYSNDIIKGIVSIFECHSTDIVAGGAEFFYQQGEKAPYTWPADPEGDPLAHALGVPLLNACFFRKNLLEKIDGFDTQYRFAGDRELMIRLACMGVRLHPLEEILYHYRLHTKALTSNPYDQWHINSRLERLDILERYLGDISLKMDGLHKLRLWHGLNIAWLVRAAMAQDRISEAARFGLRGWRYQSGWFGIYMKMILPKPSQIPSTLRQYLSGMVRKSDRHAK